jgi:hypothetical protein
MKTLVHLISLVLFLASLCQAGQSSQYESSTNDSTIFREDFESGMGLWKSESLWQIGQDTLVRAHGGSYLAGTALNGDVPNGTYTTRLISPAVTMPDIGLGEEMRLRFWYWLAPYRTHGEVYVQVDSGGNRWGPWIARPDQYTISTGWIQTSVEMSVYAGKRALYEREAALWPITVRGGAIGSSVHNSRQTYDASVVTYHSDLAARVRSLTQSK